MKRKIMIDAGHGGQFSGAVTTKTNYSGLPDTTHRESDINLKAAMILRAQLEMSGYEVMMTREKDRDFGPNVTEDLQVRCEMERMFKPECFISIHCNAHMNEKAEGFEIWTSVGVTEADRLAEEIYMAVASTKSLKMRSDMEDGDHDREKHLYVLDRTRCPAVLLELGFMTNDGDLTMLLDQVALEELMGNVKTGINWWMRN